MLQIVRAIPLLMLIVGAYGGCYTSGTKLKCTDKFIDEPLTLEIDIKACRRPVKIDFELDILGQPFRVEFNGDQDIPLPGLSIGGFGGFVLNVNANARNNGDLQLKVVLKTEVLRTSISSVTLLSRTIPNSNCNAFLLWWNSQSLAVKIAVPGGAGLFLILSIICCYCCCCKKRARGGVVVNTRPAVVMPTHIQLQNPAEKQFQYNKEVNEVA